MTDEPEGPEADPQLRRLFCNASTPLDTGFGARVSGLVRRRRRLQRVRTLAGAFLTVLGVTVVAAWAAAPLTRLSREWALYGDAGLGQFGSWLVSPAGWGCSLALACLVLWRTRAFRR